MAESLWYYRQDDRTIGPIREEQLRELADGGELRPDTYVWREGMADWVPAGHVPGLLAVGTPPPPPGGSSLAPPTEPGPHGGMAGSVPFVGYGGFWRRLVAFLIDSILLGVVTGSLEAVLGGESRGGLQTLAGWLYFALMESSRHQATLGKMALGMRVTDLEGERISFLRATGRYFAKILSALILFIGFIMIGFTQKKQGLHDMLAGTLVVRTAA